MGFGGISDYLKAGLTELLGEQDPCQQEHEDEQRRAEDEQSQAPVRVHGLERSPGRRRLVPSNSHRASVVTDGSTTPLAPVTAAVRK